MITRKIEQGAHDIARTNGLLVDLIQHIAPKYRGGGIALFYQNLTG